MIDLVTRLDEATAKRIKIYPHPNNRASEAGHPCERFLVASRIKGNMKALHGVGLQRIFDEGRVHEAALLRELEDAGFEIKEQERPFEWAEFSLAGRIDGQIKTEDGLVPLELKSCSPNSFMAVKKMSALDFLRAKQSWLRKYPGQMLCYLMMSEKQEGIMLFKNKTSGEKHQVNFVLDDEALDYTESILQKLTRVNAHVKAGTLPDVVKSDDCKGCPFCSTLCFPGQEYGPGFSVMSDADLEEKLERREELAEAAGEYEDLDKEIKDSVKGKNLVVGHFIIESKESERRSVKIPDELKKQFEVVTKYWRVTIERV
jgi:CRISPR/Cas system-associated exonuclease Cas4 (RecB family)